MRTSGIAWLVSGSLALSSPAYLSDRDHADPGRVQRSLGPALHTKFRQNVAHVRLHGLLADAEDLSDLFVRLPLGQQSQHVGLALSERLWAFGRPVLPHQARGGFRRELHLPGPAALIARRNSSASVFFS